MNRKLGPRTLLVAAWVVGMVGYWAPWLPQRAAALRLNAYDLSEWVTLLPEARDGSLPIGRIDLLAPLVCLAVAGMAIGSAGEGRLRWRQAPFAVVAIGAGLAILPSYPFILDSLRDPELKAQLLLGAGTIALALGVAALGLRSRALAAATAFTTGAFGLYYAARAFVGLGPAYARLFGSGLSPEWGWVATWAGLGSIALAAVAELVAGQTTRRAVESA